MGKKGLRRWASLPWLCPAGEAISIEASLRSPAPPRGSQCPRRLPDVSGLPWPVDRSQPLHGTASLSRVCTDGHSELNIIPAASAPVPVCSLSELSGPPNLGPQHSPGQESHHGPRSMRHLKGTCGLGSSSAPVSWYDWLSGVLEEPSGRWCMSPLETGQLHGQGLG